MVAGESRLTRMPGPVGTDGYLPPELLDGGPATPTQDLYAVGVVGTQLLTGHGPLAPVPPGPLAPLLTALRDPDPSRRPADAAAARATLRSLHLPLGPPWSREHLVPDVRDRLTRAAPGGATTRLPLPAATGVLPAALLALALLLVVLALLVRS